MTTPRLTRMGDRLTAAVDAEVADSEQRVRVRLLTQVPSSAAIHTALTAARVIDKRDGS